MGLDPKREDKLHRFAVSVMMACEVRNLTPAEISRVLGIVFDYGVASKSVIASKPEPDVVDELLTVFLDASIRQRVTRNGLPANEPQTNQAKPSASVMSAEDFLIAIPVCEMGLKQ